MECWKPSVTNKLFTYKSYTFNKEDLALNNLQWLICHKTKHFKKENKVKLSNLYSYS